MRVRLDLEPTKVVGGWLQTWDVLPQPMWMFVCFLKNFFKDCTNFSPRFFYPGGSEWSNTQNIFKKHPCDRFSFLPDHMIKNTNLVDSNPASTNFPLFKTQRKSSNTLISYISWKLSSHHLAPKIISLKNPGDRVEDASSCYMLETSRLLKMAKN